MCLADLIDSDVSCLYNDEVGFLTVHVTLMIFLGMAPSLPEDLYHLIKKAVSVRKHLERNRKVCSLLNIEACRHFRNAPFLNCH